MDSTSSQQPASSSKSGKKPRDVAEASPEPGQKPKKVNSEIRKQQNRIASRNYREKRKQKLQYLQQLLRDDPSSQENQLSPESATDGRSRSVSAEYMTPQLAPLSPVPAPPSPGFAVLPSNAPPLIGATLGTPTPYHGSFPTPTLPTQSHEPSWPMPVPVPHPQTTMPTWSPPHWTMPMNYPTPMTAQGPPNYAYSSPHPQPIFEHSPAPFPQQQQSQAGGMFHYDPYSYSRSTVTQPQAASSVSAAPSSPYNQPQYSRPP